MTDSAVDNGASRSFSSHFTFARLDGGPALAQSYALRFQVFCEELGFVPPASCPEGQESDAHDSHSLHFGAIDRHGAVVGTARLVRDSDLGLPLFSRCRILPEFQPSAGERGAVAEISRLAVSAHYRRRKGDDRYGLSTGVQEHPRVTPMARERRGRRPEIVLGLYRAMYQESKRRGIRRWYAAMEKGLARQLTRFHIHFLEVGPETDYYGPVSPYAVDIRAVEASVAAGDRALFREMVRGLDPRFLPPEARAA
jgi:N-acyl amino acid synthase of PEP-CTERM/exosortase system